MFEVVLHSYIIRYTVSSRISNFQLSSSATEKPLCLHTHEGEEEGIQS